MENLARGKSTRRMVTLSMMAAISAVLMILDFPLPFFPPFLKLDFSELPALLTAFMFGPVSGVVVALVKNLIHLTMSQTGGVGELANFLISVALVCPAGVIYRVRKSKGGALLGMMTGTVCMTIVGLLANFYILIPFYEQMIPIQTIINMCAEIIPMVKTKWDVVLLTITPFNLFKGVLISAITFFVYKKVRGLLK